MTFLIEVTHAGEQHSVDPRFTPQRFVRETAEDAAQVYQHHAEYPDGLELGEVVDVIFHGGEHTRQNESRRVSVKQVADECVRCDRSHGKRDAGWSAVKAGLLCPDCTVAVCPDDFSAVEAVV